MKLRIRSMATKETLRIEAPNSCSINNLKTLVARALSTAASTSSILPESVRLSLNRKDELFASSDQDSLQAIGLTSGDLIYFSIASDSQTLAPSASCRPSPMGISNLHPVSLMDNLGDDGDASVSLRSVNLALLSSPVHASKVNADSSSIGQVLVPDNSTAIATEPIVSQLEEIIQEDDKMEVDVEDMITGKSFSVPCFLERVMEAEKGETEGILGRLVITIQAVFLESGFVVNDGGSGYGSRLPEGWSSKASNFSIHYTLPELTEARDGRNAKAAILRFSVMGNYATVYGFLSGAHPDVYRVCFDLPKLAPILSSSFDSLSGSEEEEIFELWKVVKDMLSLPLLIDLCHKNGLQSPACFMLLPTDLKIMIFEFLSGIDVSKVGCTCSELRFLSSNNDLWKKKFLEEFGDVDERLLIGRSWKDKYANYWVRKKNADKRTERNIFTMRNTRFDPFIPQRFPMMGGDYDRFPEIGSMIPGGPRLGFAPLRGRRNFSPNCNLGGNEPGFLG
ncbi:putative F-box protein At1g23770 [Zingiber officinale]|uniref:F-box domain-containing protein n=1 Tax=Zingiber officinale TaxID=94328 RepID=A0A8J5FBJ1_ZINOF|nr:putative F-box protein At1g23770 [Zingiber officinale]KAG6483658.1 hypothetical protein ZIOFF_060310 [Zingiber officinale]